MDHILMIIIVYGYTLDSKSSMVNPDRSELVPTYFVITRYVPLRRRAFLTSYFYYHLRCYASPGFSHP